MVLCKCTDSGQVRLHTRSLSVQLGGSCKEHCPVSSVAVPRQCICLGGLVTYRRGVVTELSLRMHQPAVSVGYWDIHHNCSCICLHHVEVNDPVLQLVPEIACM